MSYFDDASLVMIPSGYKTSKVYSVKPTDGTGDLTFSRSNDTATRVASNGLIEKVRTNLILQSEAFNTTWTAVSASVTANTTANPLDGLVNADTITLTGATTQKYVTQGLSFNGNYTASAYLKAGTHQFVQIMLGTDTAPIANFDLTNGTSSATNSTASIVSVGGGFFRCSMSFTSTTGNTVIFLAVDSLAAGRFATTSSTGTFIAFGCQVETGDIATDYIATTSAAVSVGPVANVPRLDYLGSSCPRLLLEPQRTNLALFSEQIDNAAWGKTNATVTANATTSPSGYTDADKVVSTTTNGVHQFRVTVSGVTAQSYTMSIFAKKGEYNFIRFWEDGQTGFQSFYNLDTGVATNVNMTSVGIQDYGNGWYRCTATVAIPASGVFGFRVLVTSDGTANSYAGNDTNGVFVWGAQIEAGAYATSYIPTLGAAVTRGADAASKTGISSLIGQTEGTIFFEVDKTTRTDNDYRMQLSDGTTNNWLFVSVEVGNNVRLYCNVGGVNQFSVYGPALTSGRHKIAAAYKANDFKVYVDGVAVITQTSGSVPACSKFNLGSPAPTLDAANTDSKTSQALLFKTRLTNAQLAELTTI